jgi:hypothetical protein
MPDLPAEGWVLRAPVPEGIFTLSIEADDMAAAAEHAAFAERCRPLLLRAVGGDADEAAWLRAELISQLDALRSTVAASGLGYLGALAGERDQRPVLILLGIAATAQVFPGGIDPAGLLAAMLRHQYPGAAVEEFETARGVGVGIRRCEETVFAAAASVDRQPTVITGMSQALVPFPEAGLLGTVTGFCLAFADIDIATVFTAVIAHHMRVIAPGAPALPGWHRDGDEPAVSGVEQAAAWPWGLTDEFARESRADQVSFGQRGRCGETAPPCSFGLDLPAAEADAQALGFSGKHQCPPGISTKGEEAAQFASGVAIAQDLGVIDQHDARSAE